MPLLLLAASFGLCKELHPFVSQHELVTFFSFFFFFILYFFFSLACLKGHFWGLSIGSLGRVRVGVGVGVRVRVGVGVRRG